MYSYENNNKVRAIIEARRQDARSLSEARSLEVRALSPEIAEIDEELRLTAPKILRAACAGEDITPIKERNQLLLKKRRELIVGLGFSEDYTDIKYTCPKCSDIGFTPDTKICTCYKSLLITENIKSSGIGKLIEEQSFENFSFDVYKDSPENFERMKAVFEKAKTFAEEFGRVKGKNLLMIGNTGTGKTHISTSIAKVVIEKGYDVLYDSVSNIISAFEDDKFRGGYSSGEPKADKYLECDLLIVDDLGTEFLTQFTVSCLYNLFTTRKNRGLSTVISTNLNAKQLLEKYEDRIYSRIVGIDYELLAFVGKDNRLS